MGHLELVIDSDLQDVSLVAVAIKGVCLHLGLDQTRANEVELCIAEAVTNAIKHAYQGAGGHRVSVLVLSGTNELHLEIIDSGTPMAAPQIERLILGTDVVEADRTDGASLAESGRGLQIIHDLMDRVAYTQSGAHNRLQLTKFISATDPI